MMAHLGLMLAVVGTVVVMAVLLVAGSSRPGRPPGRGSSVAPRLHGRACNPRPISELLRHLIEAHCPEGWEPECFFVGPRAYAEERLHLDAAALGYPIVCCRNPASDPGHVSLITRAVQMPAAKGAG